MFDQVKKPISIFFLSLVALTIFVMPMIALAQLTAPPETVDGATALIPKLIESLLTGQYNVAGGIVLMVLMVAVRQYGLPKWNLNTDLLPIVTAVIGALSMAGLSMMNAVPVGEALKNGVVMALLAGGSWSLIGKYLAKLVLGSAYQEPQS